MGEHSHPTFNIQFTMNLLEQTLAPTPIFIEEEMQNSYRDYAMSVIIGRALPDVRDGLKPVHRLV
ncbi:MAG: hypothetical protein RBT80_07670, partial [Candidatus Vecturithrix sp.]|nr:hypothetical protein [Candidatus Vecturithrix sp.]